MTVDMRSTTAAGNNAAVGSVRDRQPVSSDRKFNKGQAAGALLVMILSGLTAVMLFSRSQATVLVWEATRDLQPGLVVAADDVRAVELPSSASVRAVDATAVSLVGSIVRIDVPVGTLLNDSMLTAAGTVGGVATIGRVGLVLEANQYPAGVAVGDSLRIVELDPDASAKRGLEPLDETLVVDVLAVSVAPGNSSELWVTVSAPLEAVDRLALMSSLELVATAKVG